MQYQLFCIAVNIVALSTLNPTVPNMANHIKHNNEGIIKTPSTNSFIVLPLEILAINIPTGGAQAIHHPQ